MLPSGKTLTGVYSMTGAATAGGQYFDSPISFGFRFASAPAVVTVVAGTTTPGEAAAAGCPGTAQDPKAAPGMVCIYEMGRDNVQGPASGYAPPAESGGTATPFGTIAEVYSDGPGSLYSNGTWAATSP